MLLELEEFPLCSLEILHSYYHLEISLFMLPYQGCALAEPGSPWCLTFAVGRLENLRISYKSYAEHPGFYRFRALGSLQFSLQHSLAYPSPVLYSHSMDIPFMVYLKQLLCSQKIFNRLETRRQKNFEQYSFAYEMVRALNMTGWHSVRGHHSILTWVTSQMQARIQDFEMGVNFCNNVIEPKPGWGVWGLCISMIDFRWIINIFEF